MASTILAFPAWTAIVLIVVVEGGSERSEKSDIASDVCLWSSMVVLGCHLVTADRAKLRIRLCDRYACSYRGGGGR